MARYRGGRLHAYRLASGLYAILGKSYHHRERIKAAGCSWNPSLRQWSGTKLQVASLDIPILVTCRAGPLKGHERCYPEPEVTVSCWPDEVEKGIYYDRCLWCDSDAERVIIEVLGS